MLMNYQAPAPQDPSTQAQLQNLQLQQALAQQSQQPQTAQGMPQQVQSPWQGAAMLMQALTSPTQQQGQGASGASTTPLQSLISWLNQDSVAGGPEEDAAAVAGG